MTNRSKIFEIVPLVPLPPRGTQKYSYLVPANLSVSIGDLVRIPFANRAVEGIVWNISKTKFPRLKSVISIIAKTIIAEEEIPYLESFSGAIIESLSLMTKSLVSVRKPVGIQNPQLAQKIGKKHSIKYIFSENELRSALQKSPTGQALHLIPAIIYADTIFKVCSDLKRDYLLYDHNATAKEKKDVLRKIAADNKSVIITTRNGIFLPFSNLKEIVIHAPGLPTHKQTNIHPYFDARVGALLKAQALKIPLCLYSHLPSFDQQALSSTDKLNFSSANIKLINRSWGETDLVSQEVVNLVRQLVGKQNKILVYHNESGFESLYVCKDCGNTLRCDNCGTILQRQGKNLFCRNCKIIFGPVQAFCGRCGSPKIHALKTGIRAVENALRRIFPELNIVVVDRDKKATRDKISEIKSADIVIATHSIFGLLNQRIFDYGLILDASSLMGISNFDGLENVLVTVGQILSLTKNLATSCLYIVNADQNLSLIKAIENNHVSDLVYQDMSDRKRLSLPPYAVLVQADKEFPSETLAKNEICTITEKAHKNYPVPFIGSNIYKRRSRIIGQVVLRGNKETIDNSVKLLNSSWSINTTRSLFEMINKHDS